MSSQTCHRTFPPTRDRKLSKEKQNKQHRSQNTTTPTFFLFLPIMQKVVSSYSGLSLAKKKAAQSS